jgi:hypothetical protein
VTPDAPGEPAGAETGAAEPGVVGEPEAAGEAGLEAEGDGDADADADGLGSASDGAADGDGWTGPGPTSTKPTSNAPATSRPASRPATMDSRDPMGREGTSTAVPEAAPGLRW